jgi:chromosome segregation ATPase
MVGLTDKVIELDQFKKGVYDSRTDLNRELKHLESQLVAVPEFPESTPDAEMNTDGIMLEQKTMNEQLQKNNVSKNALQALKTKSESLTVSIEGQKEKIEDLENELKSEKEKLVLWQKELKENQSRIEKGEKQYRNIPPQLSEISARNYKSLGN